ncbi:PAS sensor protein [Isosphaera pallida ATCC 43644]|uniref:PAS sensor protein n=1 Tax=Isosphaera pallida (strain ATCC 43644 / DSM 9630 / IS1B) TaxID=575540 RepID=E8QYA2_ISOPI|nr:PAS domain-containing protein [Isosphaera pallida]ADV63097.1 PAS sensor protein [Isosphaera pallida ATCC 43644]
MVRQGGWAVGLGWSPALVWGVGLTVASLGIRSAWEGGAIWTTPSCWVQAAMVGVVGWVLAAASGPGSAVSPSNPTPGSLNNPPEGHAAPSPSWDDLGSQDSILTRELSWVDPRDLPRWFNTLWSNHCDAMRVTDPQGTMIAVNDAFCALVDKPRPALVGRPLSVIHAKERQEHVLDAFRKRSFSRTIEPTLERRYTLWNGKTLSIRVFNLFLIGSRAPYPYILSIFHDIGDNHATEDRLRMMEALAEQIDHGAMLTGPTPDSCDPNALRVIWFNQPLQRLLGRSHEEMTQLDLATLPAEDADPSAVAAFRAAIRDGMPAGPLDLRLRYGEGGDPRASVAARVRLCPVMIPRLGQTHWLVLADPFG